ncbi:MAG: DUF6228 family protein [Armatimonadota bacterium]|nr:DUF6228 family protein [Armatimonadota bacterium]
MQYPASQTTIIHSVTGDKQLQFSDRTPAARHQDVEYIHVHLQGRDVPNCSSKIDLYYGSDLVEFFKELSDQWQGWEGEKKWESTDHSLILTATSDRLGHISLEVEISSGSFPLEWMLRTTIALEAGGLERIAADVKEFLGTEGNH